MAKREYLEATRTRYLKASGRKAKTQLLNEVCATTGYDRKYVLRRFARKGQAGRKAKPRRGRRATYQSSALLKPLKAIWRTADYPCGKRLKAMLVDWLPKYEALYGALDADTRTHILKISAATIDRILGPVRRSQQHKGRSTTKPGGLLRHQIPIQTGQWEEKRPGFLEADTVAHCGGSMAGEFVFTLNCVDVATGWCAQRAIWNKRAQSVVEQMRSIEKALPFALLGFDADNGSEFINEQLVRHFLSRQKPVQFTRSRAYRKNDNAHVEQKNWTHVRQWIGYERIDNPEAVALLNELYEKEWYLYHNLFCPSVKLIAKTRTGAKVKKTYDGPKTPYQRLMKTSAISEHTKKHLQYLFENTNPFILRKHIDVKLRKIFQLCYNPTAKNQQHTEETDGL